MWKVKKKKCISDFNVGSKILSEINSDNHKTTVIEMVIFKDNGQWYDKMVRGQKNPNPTKPKPNRNNGKKNRHFLRQKFPYHWNHQPL